jgi:hypothetical protein
MMSPEKDFCKFRLRKRQKVSQFTVRSFRGWLKDFSSLVDFTSDIRIQGSSIIIENLKGIGYDWHNIGILKPNNVMNAQDYIAMINGSLRNMSKKMREY